MKKNRFLLLMVLTLSIVFSTILFTKDTSTAMAAVNISKKSITLELGHYQTLKVYGTSKKVTWSSGNSWIASVSSTGKVTAKAAGTTTITAKVAGKKLTTKVTVLRMKGKDLTLAPGKSKTITIEGTKNKVTWISDNKSVATVSSGGKVTGKAPGVATITAKVDGKEMKAKVTVIDINHKSVVLEVGGEYGFIKTLSLGDKIDNRNVKWTSDNTKVATIGKDGRVKAQSPGNAKITAEYSGVKFTTKVKVLKLSKKKLTLKVGEEKTLTVAGTDSKIKWHSNWKTVATVDENGLVTALAPGDLTITAIVDGEEFDCDVIVIE